MSLHSLLRSPIRDNTKPHEELASQAQPALTAPARGAAAELASVLGQEGVSQRRAATPASSRQAQAQELNSLINAGSGRSLAPDVQHQMGSVFGTDFSDVRVHEGSAAPAMGAIAFTKGSDIHFAPGRYDPHSSAGRELLGHELQHVVQQREGRVSETAQCKGVALNNESGLEAEADRMGVRAAALTDLAVDPEGPAEAASATSSGVTQRKTDGVVQRRIGFEMETGIPIIKRDQDADGEFWAGLYASDVSIPLGDAQANISVDHAPGHKKTPDEYFDDWPIIEMVTDPINDGLKASEFKDIADKWMAYLLAAQEMAKKAPPPKKLLGKIYLGVPSECGYDKWERFAPQATVGVPLDQVPTLLKQFEPMALMRTGQQIAAKIGAKAPGVAAGVMQDILAKYEPGPGDGDAVQGLKALLTFVCQHLLLGGDPELKIRSGYLKNRAATIMVKTKLSTVRDNVAELPYGAKVLGTSNARKWLRHKLYAAAGRDSGEPLYDSAKDTFKSATTVGAWLVKVLNGKDDLLFNEMKNEWSDEITPDKKSEVIVELRSLGAFVAPSGRLTPSDAPGIVKYLTQVYMTNQAIKQRII